MIDRDGSKYFLVCDVCQEDGIAFSSFDDAIEYKKEEGWKSRKINGEWEDVCPDCVVEK
jgi:hypothetical protein